MPDLELGTVLEDEREHIEDFSQNRKFKHQFNKRSRISRIVFKVSYRKLLFILKIWFEQILLFNTVDSYYWGSYKIGRGIEVVK